MRDRPFSFQSIRIYGFYEAIPILSAYSSNLARTKFSRFTFLLLFRLLAPRVVISNDNRPEAFCMGEK